MAATCQSKYQWGGKQEVRLDYLQTITIGTDHYRDDILKEFKSAIYKDPKSAKFLTKESH